ncbi:hypothetical protein TTHERM_000053739 (macronuclear) [Tetrahymena thermophila SB210]|uniref:Uncharacterized protein n=1 Tax=Tetrahymena thermophila (strain SB210) TaxID=312017 RepID=W7XH72_TETTS|nr:hypothetical protein TTHERM_000053739 [Tetrahymena thermophila SB210]EWS76523.1 hypothetical protein TTHERM_000053739 [Tetrahymena thermophila SB210]|eukprot:XP_012650942.1 hypothetical protein TTHERM_000053739 [Tetrahymena thermophila SB210]
MLEHSFKQNYCFFENYYFPYEQQSYQQEEQISTYNFHYQNQYQDIEQQQQQNEIFSIFEHQDFNFNSFVDNN